MEKETLIKSNPENENTLKLKGVTKKLIKLFRDKKLPILSALGLLGGAGLNYGFMSATGRIVPTEDDIIEEDNGATIDDNEEVFDFEVPTTIEFSDVVTDDMSFGEAYKAARADTDGSGFYNWRGSTYHTLTKEEWDALSPEEQQEFLDKIQEHSDFDNGEYNKIEDDTINDDTNNDADEDKQEDEDSKEDEASDDDSFEDSSLDEVSYDDIMFDDNLDVDEDTNAKDDDFVTIDEIGDTDDILDGLNDGEATDEADGIERGDTYNPEDYKSNDTNDDMDNDLEYDNDDLDDLIS